ncbi:VPLPA-CTERM sorting domain-containing protein [Pseudooceanicola sp.]|uniref:VPLPA-CTERM sorting domain-containing protein n=1 Tax=Pseudooceanicola sp. TaxID=1914328 RepID=UPI0035129685
MRYILAILLLCAGAANASIYHYKYHGQPMELIFQPDYDYWSGEIYQPPPVAEVGDGSPIEVDIWINTALMPGGKLSDIDFFYSYHDVPAPNYLWVDGNYFFPRWGTAAFSYATLKFDADANITDWTMGVGVDYPQFGPMISNAIDRFEFYDFDLFVWESETGGYWERVYPVTPVPLPASGLLLLGGLAGLGILRKNMG